MTLNQSRKERDIIGSILHSEYSSLDHEGAVISEIFDIFGFPIIDENDEYISIDEVITKDFLEKHSNEILDKLRADNKYHKHLNHLVLGAIIIEKKAKMSRELKERILRGINWDAELKWRWKWIDKEKQKSFLEERKNLIESFKQVILEYPSSKT